MSSAAGRLRVLAAAVVVFNILATVIAVAVNLPSQFGMVGTDAGAEFVSSGTAISAPALPVVVLLLVVLLAGRPDRWRWVGIVSAYVAAIAVGIGGIGEMVAEPTADTSRTVLVSAGVVWLGIAAGLAGLATGAARSRGDAMATGRTAAAGPGASG